MGAGVDIAAEDFARILQNGVCAVGEDHFRFASAAFDQALVILDVVHAGKGVLFISESLPEFFFRKRIMVRVYPGGEELFFIEEMVADFVGRIAEHERDLFRTEGDAAQNDRETVPGKDRENDADMLSAQLCFDIRRDVLYGSIVPVRTGHDRFRYRNDVPVVKHESFCVRRGKDAVPYDGNKVVSLTDDGRADPAGNNTDCSHLSASFY